MLSARGVPATDLSRNLSIMHEVVREKLPSELAPVIDEYFEAGLKKLPSVSIDPSTFLEDAGPHTTLATKFLKLLLTGERHVASRLILEAVDSGVPLKDIYLHVFQRSQRELGRLWQLNQISVAQEHYCTAATQLIMAQLYPRIFRTEKNGRKIIATSIGGELHEIGVRIIADFFEMEGWDTYYLGANSPTAAIRSSHRRPSGRHTCSIGNYDFSYSRSREFDRHGSRVSRLQQCQGFGGRLSIQS